MASRRLTISSLLCDDEHLSSSRPPSPSPGLSPQHAGRPYASSVRNAFVPTPNPSPLGAGPTVLSPLPSPVQRQTPSPPLVSQAFSPTDFGQRVQDDVQQWAIAEFPPQPLPSSQHSPLPHSSIAPVNVHQGRRERRTSLHMNSPLQQTHPLPASLPNFSNSSSQPPSVSPSVSPSHSFLEASSPALLRLPDARIASSHRTSASLSPTASKSAAPSGLDVLVQAATEERERIDVHRRLSGGENPQLSLNFSGRPQPLSPVALRSDLRPHHPSLQPLSPASSHTIAHFPADQSEVYYQGQAFDESGRAIKRRRSSPEPSPMQRAELAPVQTTRYGSYNEPPSSRTTAGTYEQSQAIAEDESSERRVLSPYATIYSLPTTSPEYVSHDAVSSSRSTARHEVADDLEPRIPSRPMLVNDPAADAKALPVGRRSPPRSKPRPKKPGSAALAVMEREFRGVALSENSRNEQVEDFSEDMPRKGVPIVGDTVRLSKQTKSTGKSAKPLLPNEENTVDDEQDLNAFFLSAFDSPKYAGRQTALQNETIDHGLTNFVEEDRRHSSSGQRRHKPSKNPPSAQSSSSLIAKNGSPTPDAGEDTSDRYSPVRHLPSDDRELSEHILDDGEADAEVLGELADAVGTVTTDDDRTEFDDQEIDAMEVDVEDELLSLIDELSERPRSRHHLAPPSSHVHKTHASSQSAESLATFDQVSMPPPDVIKAVSGQTRDVKKSLVKPKAKSKAEKTGGASEAAKSNKKSLAKGESLSAKTSKSKSGGKPRLSKGTTVEKPKTAKSAKETSTPVSTFPPSLPVPHTAASVSIDQVFPVVTSSGRMVTKSKKSVAAAAAAASSAEQSSSRSRKKSTATSGGGDGCSSRSRSHSAIPRASVDPDAHHEKSVRAEEEKPKEVEEAQMDEDDKLYCICKTKYDEDKVMIACDRCDEWYHTQCVNMPDLEIDLVDQFICPNCIARNPTLQLCTTYKQRCFSGLSHPKRNSPDACHKPSRGAYSKYCSDECGVKHLHRKIQIWTTKGGDVHGLWETVKDAKRREGIVSREPGRTLPKSILAELQNGLESESSDDVSKAKPTVDSSDERRESKDSVIERLESRLQSIVREREERKKEMEVVAWRERLLRLAADRAENVHECGWDQRLCFGDEEWMEFGEGVLESYEDRAPDGHTDNTEEHPHMDVDEQVGDGEWWCQGKKKCERHAGWQKLRSSVIKFEKESKEDALVKLTTREREIRSRIEDILHPQSRSTTSGLVSKFTFKLGNGFNPSEDGVKKGKKKPNVAA